eukprot:3560350-Pyramimonas_sp.AAC.1
MWCVLVRCVRTCSLLRGEELQSGALGGRLIVDSNGYLIRLCTNAPPHSGALWKAEALAVTATMP